MYKDVSIIAGPSSLDLATALAKHLDAELVPVDLRIFKDGEIKIKMRKVDKDFCIVVQSTYPPTDRHLLQALMMIKKCSDDGAANVCAVMPYMAYSRQDRAFLDGEVVSMALVAKLIETVGTKQLITVDIHSPASLSYFTIDTRNISAVGLLAEYVALKIKPNAPIVVSPDMGGAKRAAEFARTLRTDLVALTKSRDKNTAEVLIENKELNSNVVGRDLILLDDMISTGESIAEACRFLRRYKPNKIYAICTHALLIGDATTRIKAAGVEEIISTNSVPGINAKIDLAPLLSTQLEAIINKKHFRS
ncbi:MAG TPA: ribose-phosphate pyrophosphokinase [Candidatus Nitrosopolaris sp.]|nr:ribose-phosphate pyrophosphokinase [Candidatus Nitrosopolaris sp.]